MKPITKERCLATLDRISEVCHKRDKYAAVLRQASLNGMRVLTGSISESDNDRLGLEMAIAGMPFPKSEADIERLLDQKEALYKHYWSWRDRVYAIQAKHKLSGLEIELQTIFGVVIEQPNVCSSDGLPFIAEDMPTLRSYRPKIVAQFVQALRGELPDVHLSTNRTRASQFIRSCRYARRLTSKTFWSYTPSKGSSADSQRQNP